MATDFYQEIILDGVRFSASSVQVNQLASFQPKNVFGDYTKDSNNILSSWVISDLSGGHGIVDLKGTDSSRFRFGTLNTRFPGQISLPKATTNYLGPGPTIQCYPLGDYVESSVTRFFAAQGTTLLRWDENAGPAAFGASLGTLTADPVGKAVAYQGVGTYRLFIPMGSSGYARWDGAALTNVASSGSQPAALALTIWDDKLVALDILGQLWYSTDGTTFASYGVTAKLDDAYEPRNIVVGYDRSENPCIHVVTDRDVWSFDPAGPKLYKTDLYEPPTPNSGKGSCMWRGAMYVSSSMGVMQYTGSAISAMGLDRDDGLPYEYRNYIVDLEPEFNGMYALVRGNPLLNVIPATTTVFSLQVYTGFGWHTEWVSIPVTGSAPPTADGWVRVSNAQGKYRLWWSNYGYLTTMSLPTDYANPRALVTDEIGDFAIGDSYEFSTGKFDASMKGYTKIASHIDVFMSGDMTDAVCAVYYRVDDEVGFHSGQTVTSAGRTVLLLGTVDASGSHIGVPFNKIELHFIMQGATATTSPILEDLTLAFTKVVKSSFNWTVQIDLTKTHNTLSSKQLSDKIDELIDSTNFFTFTHLGENFRVRLAQYSGQNASGHDPRKTRTVSILEIPAGL